MRSPRFRLVADVRSQIDTLHPAEVCIGPEGDLWMIAHDRPPAETHPTDPDRSGPDELTVLSFHDGILNSAVTVRNAGRRSFVQPLRGDELLLVAARTSGEPNARVVNVRGATVRDFMLGDGIEDVQTTLSADIWVSYTDQGISVGTWNIDGTAPAKPFDPANLSDGSKNEHCGLLRATNIGRVSWRFTDTATIKPIFWCDGLNVAGDASAVWACYTVFPGLSETCSVVRIDRDGTRRVWRVGRSASRGLAVHGETILLGGGYADNAGSPVLGRLGESGAVEGLRSVRRIRGETAEEIRVIGRGPVMHWVRGTRWYALDLRD